MAIFDILKKKELAEIERLNQEIIQLKSAHFNEIQRLSTELAQFRLITDIEKEAELRKHRLEFINNSIETETNTKKVALENLNSNYQKALETFNKLSSEISLFESKLNFIEFGVYEPTYNFERSDQYKFQQSQIIDKQKAMIQSDNAAVCFTNWSVGNSEAKGRAVINKYKKLMLRAFNGEADALIAKVKWNNIAQSKERLLRIFNAIDKLGEGFFVNINPDYFQLKREELILEYEYQAKKQQEREEMKAIQDEIREEEKAKRDFEKAQREAEKEEATFQKALEKTRAELARSSGVDTEKLQNQIVRLEQELKESRERQERALSMAQQTKRGHVYIISNIGAFGENVYKIGMTRRLEPMDRVRELGDASVPFQFDVHAMIYSDEARTLEAQLHQKFANKKVNMLNYRKEFFKVTLDEIIEAIKEMEFNSEFVRIPEAKEFRETMAFHQKENKTEAVLENPALNNFPVALI